MSEQIAVPFFDSIGMGPVIWIDDRFAPRTRRTEDIVEAVAAALFAGNEPSHPKLKDLTASDSAEEWAANIEKRLDSKEIDEFLDRVGPFSAGTDGTDYSAGEIDVVANAMAASVNRMTFETWWASKAAYLPPQPNSVFVVDRENGDNGRNAGDEIVKELLASDDGSHLVIVLTHSVGAGGTEALRRQMEKDLNLPKNRLGVASKRDGSQNVQDSIRSAIRVVATQLVSARAADQIGAVMKSSIEATKDDLARIPLQALDKALFQSPFAEGISEIEVLTRILLSQQRAAVEHHVAVALAAVTEPLNRLRTLRRLVPAVDETAAQSTTLRSWRQAEVFDPGDRLNALFAPIACGDLFEKHGNERSTRMHVLLGPPCDMAVRPDGTRVVREAVFVEMARFPNDGRGRFFELPEWMGTGLNGLDFRSWRSVNLDCVEWVSFNSDGFMRVPPTSPVSLLPGWAKRLEGATARLTQENSYHLSITLSSGLKKGRGSIEFPYRRIGRLREPWASAAFLAFSNFQARAAYEHDYTEGIGLEGDPNAT